MTDDIRTRVLTYDADKRWYCTGLRRGFNDPDAGRACGHSLVSSIEDPSCLECVNQSCERFGLLIEHPDLRSCNTRPGKRAFDKLLPKEDSHGRKGK